MAYRIGQGFDVHQLSEGYKLTIGGVEIEYNRGSKGHSDGDVLYHAIVDALLGALALGDIGTHFPSSDECWKGADSSIFLKHALMLIAGKKYKVVNIDATVILQKPKLSTHIQTMRENLAEITGSTIDCIAVKATTTDFLGYTGRGEGLACTAIVLLEELEN